MGGWCDGKMGVMGGCDEWVEGGWVDVKCG